MNSIGSSMGVNGWLNAVSRQAVPHEKYCACPTLRSEGARRRVHDDPREICSRGLRVSKKPASGRWQLAQATFPVSPFRPRVPGSPLLASSSNGPENTRIEEELFAELRRARIVGKAIGHIRGGRRELRGRERGKLSAHLRCD